MREAGGGESLLGEKREGAVERGQAWEGRGGWVGEVGARAVGKRSGRKSGGAGEEDEEGAGRAQRAQDGQSLAGVFGVLCGFVCFRGIAVLLARFVFLSDPEDRGCLILLFVNSRRREIGWQKNDDRGQIRRTGDQDRPRQRPTRMKWGEKRRRWRERGLK